MENEESGKTRQENPIKPSSDARGRCVRSTADGPSLFRSPLVNRLFHKLMLYSFRLILTNYNDNNV